MVQRIINLRSKEYTEIFPPKAGDVAYIQGVSGGGG